MEDLHTNLESVGARTDGIDPALVDQELQRVLKSRHFRHSKRASQFLKFVTAQKLSGNQELVKERLIGVELFGRKVDYATGDDPIVRVQGGEVRRRLEMYQNDLDPERQIAIELPLGSYVPVFRVLQPADEPAPHTEANELTVGAPEPEIVSAHLPVFLQKHESGQAYEVSLPQHRSYKRLLLGAALGLIALCCGVGYLVWAANSPAAQLKAFWGPAFKPSRPVLICLGKPILYKPRFTLFQRYMDAHPGSFSSAVDRHNLELPLDPQESIRWGDLYVVTSSGPAVGGVRAGMNVSALFGRRNVPFGVRFGEETTFTDLREAPAVIVGAMNSRWILRMATDLRFAMTEIDGRLWVKEAGPNGRMWGDHAIPNGWRDYGLITRQLNSPTGQFLVRLEGIMDSGTQACSEVVTDPETLQSILKDVPKGWEKKNLQLVVVTDITDGKAGPPKLIAFNAW